MNTGQKTLTLTALLLILIIIPTAHATTTTLTGSIITQETGQPIPDAEITVLYRQYRRRWSTGWYTHSTTTTNQQGQYTLNLETDTNYLILVTHKQDQKHTHIPIGIYHTSTNQTQTKNIQLQKTATIKLKGLAYFIETTAIPENTFRVTEPGTNEAIEYGDLNLVYGLGTGSITTLLQLPTDQIYVPTEQPLEINVQSYTSTHGDNLQKTLTLNQAPLIPGEATEIDLRAHILPQGIQTLQNKTRTLQTLINQKEKEGFYLAVERQQINQIHRLTNDATSLTNQGRFSEAFAKCRETYIQIQDLENGLNNLITDARRSVYILVAFTTITSIITATMLHEDHTRKIATSTIIFTLLLISLQILHPGAQITRTRDLVKNSAIIYTTLTIITITLPRLLNTQSKGKDVSLLNMTVPILSIAKRSLRRRRLRFILTLTSVLLLVASFISLTSFTSGYGLSHTRVSTIAKPEGVMIRTPDPPPTRAAAPFSGGTGAAGPLPLDESLIGWYTQIDEIIEASPRYENYPQRQYRESYSPIAYINKTPLFGIVAINPETEARINQLDTALREGRYNIQSGEALITMELAQRLGANLGDKIPLTAQEKTHNLTIAGLLDDKTLTTLTDLDGDTILPRKIIEAERVEADGPDFVIEEIAPCSPDETIWINLETGENISAVWLSRINLFTTTDTDVTEYARSITLNRGFRAWASTNHGTYLTQLQGYFEGKGLPIVIPWIIVVLNVVVTMMNAYYERRHDVMIYSSIGMNPRHISSIFLAEAAVIGALGGCIGYLVGLGAYKVIYILTPALQVKQKVSAFWSLAAIGISIMAVLVGGISALKNSTSITPSLRRRWKIEKEEQETRDATRIKIPVQVYQNEINYYLEFIMEKLEEAKKGRTMNIKMPKSTKINETTWEYSFIYSSASAQISALYTRNRLVIQKEEKIYTTTLYTTGDTESVKQAGSFTRHIALAWSLKRQEEHEQ